jgi:hypothetical protein
MIEKSIFLAYKYMTAHIIQFSKSAILYILINEKSTADYCKLQPLRESFSKNDIRLNLDVKEYYLLDILISPNIMFFYC